MILAVSTKKQLKFSETFSHRKEALENLSTLKLKLIQNMNKTQLQSEKVSTQIEMIQIWNKIEGLSKQLEILFKKSSLQSSRESYRFQDSFTNNLNQGSEMSLLF